MGASTDGAVEETNDSGVQVEVEIAPTDEPAPTQEPTDEPTATGSPTSTDEPTSGEEPTSTASPTDDGALSETGFDLGEPLLFAAAALVLVGGLVYLAVRRRARTR